jgi:hypothetical protein
VTQPNPYQSSELAAEAPQLPPGILTVGRALRFVLLTMVLFAALGAIMGLTIGLVMPRYYVQLFGVSDGMAPVAGALLGTTQGGGAGIAVGVLLAAIVAWVQLRVKKVTA